MVLDMATSCVAVGKLEVHLYLMVRKQCCQMENQMRRIKIFSLSKGKESNKEMNRRELLNQPMRVQIAGLPHTDIISLSE